MPDPLPADASFAAAAEAMQRLATIRARVEPVATSGPERVAVAVAAAQGSSVRSSGQSPADRPPRSG